MKIAVVGVSGLVGQVMMKLLKSFDCDVYYLGKTSAGTVLDGKVIVDYQRFDYDQVDGVLVSSGEDSAKWVSMHAAGFVIDNSPMFRASNNVALVVPEIYEEEITRVVSSPNCVAIPLSLVLKPLLALGELVSVWGSTYQSVSGAGRAAMVDLKNQQGVYNTVCPVIGEWQGGKTGEEVKIENEVNRLLGQNIPIDMMCVRVPIAYGHSMHIRVRFDRDICQEGVLEILRKCPYIVLYENDVPDPLQCVRSEKVHVGRVQAVGCDLALWVVADNLYRGAAWNCVEIARRFFGLTKVSHE